MRFPMLFCGGPLDGQTHAIAPVSRYDVACSPKIQWSMAGASWDEPVPFSVFTYYRRTVGFGHVLTVNVMADPALPVWQVATLIEKHMPGIRCLTRMAEAVR